MLVFVLCDIQQHLTRVQVGFLHLLYDIYSPSISLHFQMMTLRLNELYNQVLGPYNTVKFRIYVIKFKYPPQQISLCTLFLLANHFTDWLPWHPYNLIFCRAPVLTLPQESIFVFLPSRGRSKQLL